MVRSSAVGFRLSLRQIALMPNAQGRFLRRRGTVSYLEVGFCRHSGVHVILISRDTDFVGSVGVSALAADSYVKGQNEFFVRTLYQRLLKG